MQLLKQNEGNACMSTCSFLYIVFHFSNLVLGCNVVKTGKVIRQVSERQTEWKTDRKNIPKTLG